MTTREYYEFLKYFANRPLEFLFGDWRFVDKHMKSELSSLRESLRVVKESYSIAALKDGRFGQGKAFFMPFEKPIVIHGNYYDAFPLYSSCSWRLNKEFRKLHDELTAYLISISA
mgnify:CR=1 FL=1